MFNAFTLIREFPSWELDTFSITSRGDAYILKAVLIHRQSKEKVSTERILNKTKSYLYHDAESGLSVSIRNMVSEIQYTLNKLNLPL